jgi:hypothetical protein
LIAKQKSEGSDHDYREKLIDSHKQGARQMKKTLAFSAFWFVLLLCSSRGTDLFHITADEQLAKFQDLFRSLVSEDHKSLSKTIGCFVLGNDPEGTDQVVIYDHDSFVNSLTTPSSNYDHLSVMVDKESLTTKTDFRCRKSIEYGECDRKQAAQYESYTVADSEIIYQCTMTQKSTGARWEARIKVSMENVYTDEYPDGIITCLYFNNVDQQNVLLSPRQPVTSNFNARQRGRPSVIFSF